MRYKRIMGFVDLENIQISFQEQYGKIIKPQLISKIVANWGEVIGIRAYANYRLQSEPNIKALRLAGMEMIHSMNWSSQENGNGEKKTSTVDEQINVDITETVLARRDIKRLALVSGDGGYLPALNICRKRRIEIIVIAVPQCTNSLLINLADEFIPLFPEDSKRIDLVGAIKELEDGSGFLTFSFIMDNLLKGNKCLFTKQELHSGLNKLIQEGTLKEYKKAYRGELIPAFELNHHSKESTKRMRR